MDRMAWPASAGHVRGQVLFDERPFHIGEVVWMGRIHSLKRMESSRLVLHQTRSNMLRFRHLDATL